MGIILDSSVLIATEREGKSARETLSDIATILGETEVGISVISLIELGHGAARADNVQREAKREKFIQDLVTGVPVYPITISIALRAGHLDGRNQARGIRVPLADLLIAVTALEVGYSVGTANLRHFNQIAGLKVVQL